MTSRKLKIGVVGTGVIATSVHIPVIQNLDDAEIAWVTDVSFETARKVASHIGSRAIDTSQVAVNAADCDIVLLAIPLLPRSDYFELLCDSGATVLCEKPLALNASDHRRYCELFGDRRLSICYARRFHGTSRLIREIINSGPFGPLKAIRIAEGGLAGRTGGGGRYQDESFDRGGGITLNLACHSLDCAFWVSGATSYKVQDAEIAWDNRTDRRMKARIALEGVAGRHKQAVDLDIIVTNLDIVSNQMEFVFDEATLRCPIPASDQFEFISNSGPLAASVMSLEGARNSMESYFQMWRNVSESHRSKSVSDVSATSNIVVAELIDELLAR
jgi:predicted dehydrogenase